jgi:hypothetical protein
MDWVSSLYSLCVRGCSGLLRRSVRVVGPVCAAAPACRRALHQLVNICVTPQTCVHHCITSLLCCGSCGRVMRTPDCHSTA